MEFDELVNKTYREYFSALFAGGGESAKGKLFIYMSKASDIECSNLAKLSEDSSHLYDDFEWFVGAAHTDVMFGMLEDGSAGAKRVIKTWLAIASRFNTRGE